MQSEGFPDMALTGRIPLYVNPFAISDIISQFRVRSKTFPASFRFPCIFPAIHFRLRRVRFYCSILNNRCWLLDLAGLGTHAVLEISFPFSLSFALVSSLI